MSMTVSDITRDADVFRRAYPSWPLPEPGPDESGRCTSCGHLPGCECPEDCTTEAQEAARLAALECFLGGPVVAADAEEVFALIGEVA